MRQHCRTILCCCLLLAPLATLSAQDTAAARQSTKVKITPYGFVRNYLNVDSRRMMTVCGGEYLMIPYDEDWNLTEAQAQAYGTDDRFDRNDVAEAHFLALSTRFGLSLDGGQVGQARLSGKVEGDFAGFGTSNTVLRLRLAYVRLVWDAAASGLRHELLAGQDWHPLSGSIMPEAVGMAAGAPFRPHSRTPQLRYTLHCRHGLGLTAAALWQYQFTSPGPDGESVAYANRSLVPEMFLGFNYRLGDIYAQLGIDYTNLLVRREVPVASTPYTRLDEGRCHSFSPTAYFQYTPGLFSLKLRSTLARNLGHLNMLSGYAWAADADGHRAYVPMQASVSYVDLAYGSRWRVNLFLGYQKNLGLADGDYSIADADPKNLYMKKSVSNLNSIWRVAPSVSYNTKAFNLGLEYELTGVAYGDLDLRDGTVSNNDNLRHILGHRLCAMVKYNF